MVNKVEKLKIDVQGMREKILDLAMRGKLVSQDKNDEPASVLLEKIAKEKEQLIKEKKIKKTKLLPEITDEEKPFDIPESWEWVRLGEIFFLKAGKGKKAKEIFSKKSEIDIYPCFGGNGIRGYVNEFNYEGNYALIGRQGALCGNINLATGKFWATEHAVVTQPYVNMDFKWIGYFLEHLNLNQYATSVAQPGLAVGKINTVVFPLPPLNEQKRIAAKVEELFKLLDIVEESTNSYENLQKELKEKLLELGMQGKLVEQDKNDESASKLYEQIQGEKVQLIKEKKIKKTKPLPEISDEEKPFDIPDSWKWVRIGNIGQIISGGTPKTKERSYWVNGNIPWITPAVMAEAKNKKIFKSKNIKYINNEGLNHSSAQLIPANSLVMSSRAPIGYINIVPFEYTTNQGCKSVTLMNKVSTSFMYNALKFRVPDMEKRASGTTFKEISGTKFSQTILPLPPINEQKRIATKIEELFNTIDN